MAEKPEAMAQVKVLGTHYASGSGAPFPPGSIVPMKESHAEQLLDAGHAELHDSRDE